MYIYLYLLVVTKKHMDVTLLQCYKKRIFEAWQMN